MGSPEFNRRWKLFVNGLVQTVYSAIAASLATLTINGMFDLEMEPKTMGLIILGSVIGAVIGYFQRSPLPDLFEVISPVEFNKVADVVEVADKEIVAIAEKANEDIAEIITK